MLFLVQMKVNPPTHLAPDEFARVKEEEKQRALEIQRQGSGLTCGG